MQWTIKNKKILDIDKNLSRILNNYENVVDRFLLTGFWTPQGFVDRTKLFIEENK